jgi:fatty acid CoA ligase FadD32
VLLVTAGSVPRTSSGKIGRRATRAAYIDGTLRSGTAAPNSFPDQTD